MGIYYEPKEPAIVPDGFLSLAVERRLKEELIARLRERGIDPDTL